MNVKLREFVPLSWFHPVGAKILARRLSERTPNLCNAVTVMLSVNPNDYANPLEAWARGVLKSANFIEAFRNKYGPTEYFIGLEFTAGEWDGQLWPHWHVILLRRGTYDKEWLTRAWGLGATHVERIYDVTMPYFLKYVSKALESVPDWVKPLNRIRRVRYSRNFLAKLVVDDVRVLSSRGMSHRRAQRTIGERLEAWQRMATVEVEGMRRAVKLRETTWKTLLTRDLFKLVNMARYDGFGVLALDTKNKEHSLWLMQNLKVSQNPGAQNSELRLLAALSDAGPSGNRLRRRTLDRLPTISDWYIRWLSRVQGCNSIVNNSFPCLTSVSPNLEGPATKESLLPGSSSAYQF